MARKKESRRDEDATRELYFDVRLQARGLREGKITEEQLQAALEGLPDVSDAAVVYDERGVPTNLPERKLKTLPMKASDEVEVPEGAAPAPGDPLSGQWEDIPRG